MHMYGLEKGRLADIRRDPVLRKNLLDVARVFLECFEDEMESYYCYAGFTVIIDGIKEHTKEMVA